MKLQFLSSKRVRPSDSATREGQTPNVSGGIIPGGSGTLATETQGVPDHKEGGQVSGGGEKAWSLDKVLLYALIFLTPIFFLPATLSPVALNKQLFVGVVIFGLVIYVLARFLATGKIIIPKTLSLFAVLGLFLAVLLSAALSKAQSVSFFGTSPDSLFWVSMYVAAFLLAVIVLRDKKSLVLASIAYLGGTSILVVFSLLQFSGISLLPFDFAQNASFNSVGTVFAVGFVAASVLAAIFSFWISEKSSSKKVKVALGILAGFFALLVIQINLWTIWLVFALTFAVISLVVAFSFSKDKELSLKPLLLPFFVIMISLLAVSIKPVVPAFIDVPAELGPTLSATVDITKDSLGGIRAIYGTGPGTFAYNYSLNRSLAINQTNFWGVKFNQGYSAFLTYTSTWGILGVAALLVALLSIYRTLFFGIIKSAKKNSQDKLVEAIALAGFTSSLFLGIGMFLYKGNVVMHLLLFLSAGIGVSALVQLNLIARIRVNLLSSIRAMLTSSLVAIVLISSSLGGLYFLGQRYLSSIYLAQGVQISQEEQDLNKALLKLNQSIRANSKNDLALRVSAQALLLRMNEILTNEDLSDPAVNEQFGAVLQNAISVAREATNVNSQDTQNWIQLGRVYEQVIGFAAGAEDLAIDAYQKTRELDPLNPSLPLAQARTYVATADVLRAQLSALAQSREGNVSQEKELTDLRFESLNKAIEKLNESIELKADYSEARFLLAATYQRLGELDKAIEETQNVAFLNPNDPNIAFQLGLLRYESNAFEQAKVSLERAIVLADGLFGNARYYLGLAYEKLGDKQAAIAQFEKLQEDNPENALVVQILDNLNAGLSPLSGIGEPVPELVAPDTGGAEEPVLP